VFLLQILKVIEAIEVPAVAVAAQDMANIPLARIETQEDPMKDVNQEVAEKAVTTAENLVIFHENAQVPVEVAVVEDAVEEPEEEAVEVVVVVVAAEEEDATIVGNPGIFQENVLMVMEEVVEIEVIKIEEVGIEVIEINAVVVPPEEVEMDAIIVGNLVTFQEIVPIVIKEIERN